MDIITGPKTALDHLREEQWVHFSDFTGWTEANIANTGTTAGSPRLCNVAANGTAASTAVRRTGANNGWSIGKANTVLNWSKQISIFLAIAVTANTTNGIVRFTLGKATADGVGVLDDKGIGLSIAALQASSHVHDGSDATTTSLGASGLFVASQVHSVFIQSDGAGNVSYYVDGTFVHTNAGGPTGDSTASHQVLQLEVDNGADSANQSARIVDLNVHVVQ